MKIEKSGGALDMGDREKKKEYSFEVVETAENLYVYRQKTYEEISRITGVPVVTIQRWSTQYEWRKKRTEQIKRRVDYRKNLYELRDKILEMAREDTNPQNIYALFNLQKAIEAEERMKPLEDLPTEPEKGIGLSEETLRKIREEVYGIRRHEEI